MKMNRDEMAKKLDEMVRPESERIWSDHKRLLDAIYAAPKTADQEKAFEEHLRKRALGDPKRKFPIIGVVFLLAIVVLTVLAVGAIR